MLAVGNFSLSIQVLSWHRVGKAIVVVLLILWAVTFSHQEDFVVESVVIALFRVAALIDPLDRAFVRAWYYPRTLMSMTGLLLSKHFNLILLFFLL